MIVFNVMAVLVALVLGAVAGAIIMGVGLRGRRRDDAAVVAQAFADLVELAAAAASADKRQMIRTRAGRIVERWRPDAHQVLPEPEPVVAAAPPYVHRLLDAYATGDAIDLSGCWVPPEVQGRLRAILAAAGERTTPMPSSGHNDLRGGLAAAWRDVEAVCAPDTPVHVDAVNAELNDRVLRAVPTAQIAAIPHASR